jgi:hypothetical protein
MVSSYTMVRKGKILPGLLVLYGLASLVHFVHNAEYLVDYPNLPAWLSRFQIYVVWCGITALGLAGYTLYRRSHTVIGLSLVAVYAAFGFDALLHYRRAPFAAHTVAMNLTIWSEIAAAALVVLAVIKIATARIIRNA